MAEPANAFTSLTKTLAGVAVLLACSRRRWDGLTLVVRADAERIVAFPHLPVDFPPADMTRTCAGAGPVLKIPYGERVRGAKVRVLIGLFRGQSATYHWVELPAPPPKKT